MKTLVHAALLLILMATTAGAQLNAGQQQPESTLPCTMNQVLQALPMTSGTMLTATLLACVEPARRALRIYPTDASRHL
jgi:ABC-type lipoprotein release transport system permease subunit